MIIENGVGNSDKLKINGINEAHVFAVTESESQAAAESGDAYNINTGDITCNGDTTLIYFKNDETTDAVIEAFAVGIKGSTVADQVTVTVIRNPTGGDLITDATACDMKANRNFGSSKTLKTTSLAYKGKVSGTITGGEDIIQIYMGNNSRLLAGIDMELPRGSSIAVKIEGTATGGSAYGALIMHTKNADRA